MVSNAFDQGSLNFFVRGPHTLIKNIVRAGCFMQCDWFSICYILPNRQIFRKHISQFSFSIFFSSLTKWLRRPQFGGPAFEKSQKTAQVVRPSSALCSRLSSMSYTSKEVDITLLKLHWSLENISFCSICEYKRL